MPKLPSGRVIGISNERARYHATRLNMRVNKDTPHSHLYRLVDVIIAENPDNPETWKKKFRFSGYTLADNRWLECWQEDDRRFFQDWLQDSRQVQEIEGARTKLIYDNLPLKILDYYYPCRLYSLLMQELEAITMPIASPAQWRHTILNLRKRGIRQEELSWSGVLEFLCHRERQGMETVSKTELLANVDFSAIRMELTNELVKNEDRGIGFEEVAQRLPVHRFSHTGIRVNKNDIAVLRYRNRDYHYRIGMIKTRTSPHNSAHLAGWFVIGPSGNGVITDAANENGLYSDAEAARNAASGHAREIFAYDTGLTFSNKYKFVSLYGGSHYLEWLVTLPDYPLSHFSSHFTERNVLLHIRTKIRYGDNVRKLLFIEEIQSDWHQALVQKRQRRWGENQIPLAPFKNEWVSMALKMLLFHAIENDYDGIAWTPGRIQEARYHQSVAAINRVYDQLIPQTLLRLGRRWQAKTDKTEIETVDSSLRALRDNDKWYAVNEDATFKTRARYSMDEIIELMAIHGKAVKLPVPVFYIPEGMRNYIRKRGLPMFGESLDM